MANQSLTRRQRQILELMHKHGPAKFHGGTRGFHWRVLEYGVAIQAYQDPEMYLARRGLIAEAPMNVPGKWFRLTADGADLAAKVASNS